MKIVLWLLSKVASIVKSVVHCEEVLVLGDSHAEIFKHWLMPFLFLRTEFRVCSVGGATASGLENPNSKTQAYTIFKSELGRRKWDRIILLLGEVDTGFVIWFRSKKYGIPVEKMFEKTMETYLRFISEIRAYGELTVISAPLPTIKDGAHMGDVANERKSIDATQKQRTELTLEFNHAVQNFCSQIGVRYVSLDDDSLGEDGLVSSRLLNKNLADHHYDKSPYVHMLHTHLKHEFK